MAMQWDDLRFFLTVARAASFSAAAKELGVNQSTVSRRLAALERRLGTLLVTRHATGHLLTPEGSDLAQAAEPIAAEIGAVLRQVEGRDAQLGGVLRVTCVEMMIDRFLAPHFARFCREHPGLALTLQTSMRPLDLMRSEADVAIRVSESPPPPLVGRRLCDFALAVYGATTWRTRAPDLSQPDRLDWIGWADDAVNARVILDAFPAARIAHEVDGLVALSAMVREGAGISVLPCYWADRDPGLARLSDAFVPRGIGIWVLMHPEVRHAARVRAFVDMMTKVLLANRAAFEGQCGRDSRQSG
ncbi:LysR family transcriptional regulator [Defluviimonas salinarum]|uniref:LysR family transcriptional regulator n=1 Tax=Defluviimonas salinarum TaxID=2992147 RepID=A0ABT3J4T1_9RHOB|nr:LysR family transcriptional regulator [Defluviimonas salinarum]MCW3782687.1 LysR family transcriptional regulator [Defluviimonas salinarum]